MNIKKLLLTGLLVAGGLAVGSPAVAFDLKRPKVPNPIPGGGNPLEDARKRAEEEARKLREARDRALDEGRRAGEQGTQRAAAAAAAAAAANRKVQEEKDRVAREAAKVDELRRRAEAEIGRFKKLQKEAVQAVSEYDRLQKLATADDPRVRDEVYRQLRTAGVMSGNQAEVKKGIDAGFGLSVWGKEIDHIEQQKFAVALAASVASSNPAPALAYVKQYALDTQRTVLAQLKNAPAEARKKVEAEFERLLVGALDAAVRNGRVPELKFDGVTLSVGLATYNHWCLVKYQFPELVPTEKVLGVQLYDVKFKNQERKIPLPNTFQPYVRVQTKVTVR